MAFAVDEKGNIKIIQGDSGIIVFNNIPIDKNYKAFFGVQDAERNPIGSEIMVETLMKPSVAICMTGNYTDLFVVPDDQKSAIYYYGLKLCYEADGTEDTLILGTAPFGEQNTITVYPRKVKGI